ncbi:MAG TPA: nuclear transport factor 2 family protein [Gaiellales bacterium]|nr:nuclear transport factor 2 family protein [Gaiellales bacterium]
MPGPDSADALQGLIDRYNDAWNRQDVDAIVAMHTPDMVFHNHTAGEVVEGEAVREHIAGIFRNWPGMTFSGRSLYVRDGLVVQEWTATGTHAESGRSATWDGMDILPTRDGKFARKDVYSDSVSVMRQLGRL